MKRNYIGLASSFHDPSIAIVNSKGELVFAEAFERYSQMKRAPQVSLDQLRGYFFNLIKTYVEPGAQLVVAQSWSDNAINNVKAILDWADRTEADIGEQFGEITPPVKRCFSQVKYDCQNWLIALQKATNFLELFSYFDGFNSFCDYQIKRYDHHLTHAATACYSSPFDEGCCAILDGWGETRAYNCYHYQDRQLKQLPGIEDMDGSLGNFYARVCETCGFDRLAGEEWKVMGLAAYGQFEQKVYDTFKSEMIVNGLNLQQCSNERFFNYYLKEIYEMTRKKETPALSAANIAYTGQLVFNELLYEYLNNLHQLGLSNNLIMGGGCCLNSSANGMITEKTGFKNLFVCSAPADDGNSIGAALLAYYEDHPLEKKAPKVQSPYLGSDLSQYKIDHLKRFGNTNKMRQHPEDIHYQAAKLLAEGKIIGWVQGRAEFGPRALGNRSILADPRSPDIKDIINDRVKFREEFRPLAPSILHEFGPEYFENYQEAPYMERTLRFKEAVKSKVPGVVHEDGTGRLQTVKKEWNERYYNLIKAFYELTGIPLVLNTSFNVMGKPMVHSVEDAIAVFYTTGLDALIIGDLLIEKD